MSRDDPIRRGDALDAFDISADPRGYIEKLVSPVTAAGEGLRLADGVPVVRCADCRNCLKDDPYTLWCVGRGWPYQLVQADGFCERGKRKETA